MEEIEKEIDYLLTTKEELRQENKELEARIDKAIEYIETLENVYIGLEENKYNLKKMYASEKNFVKDLLNILKGEE